MRHRPLYPITSPLEEPTLPSEKTESPYYGYGLQPGQAPNQLLDLLGLLKRGKWIILFTLIAVVGVVGIYVYTVQPEYEAQSLLLVQKEGAAVTGALGTDIEKSLGLDNRSLDDEIMIIKQSVAIANRVADRLIAQQVIPDTEERLTILYDEEGLPLSSQQVGSRLSGNSKYVAVRQEGRFVNGIWIVGSSTIPGEAALIANLYAEEYIARTQEASRARIFASRTFLEEQEEKLRADLQSLEDQLKAYMSEQGAAALDVEATRTVDQIAQLQAMRDEAKIELGMKEASLRALQGELAAIEPKLVQRMASGVGQELTSVQEELAALELRIEQIYLLQPDLKENPSGSEQLADLNRQSEQLRKRSQQLAQQYVAEVLSVGGVDPTREQTGGLAYVGQRRQQVAETQIEINGLHAKIEVLEQRLQGYQGKMRSIPRQSIQLAQLQRAQQSTEQLYLFLVQKLQEARIAEESEVGYAEIIRPASLPALPVRPNRKRNLLLAVVFGFMLGCGLVLARHRLDTKLNLPADLRDRGHNVLGVIPSMKKIIKHEFQNKEHVMVEDRPINTTLTMLLNPQSRVAEAYRQLRTNIQFSRPDSVIEALLLTSPEPGEGKTTTAINLALAMAQASRRTLILDADLRRPRTHEMLGLSRQPGLTEILFNEHAFSPEEFATGFDNLYLLPAGRDVPNPVEVLGSQRMRTFLEQMRQEFDLVIIDTPPTVAFSEAMLLSTQCDATLLVAAAGKTDRRAYEHAAEVIRGVGGVLIGGVLNQFDAEQLGSGYAYGYRYGDSYYHYRKDGYGKRKGKKA